MTYEENLDKSAALLNDQSRAVYTDAVLLPYLNIAQVELEEVFELNNIPVTNEVSSTITVPADITTIGYNTTPALPEDLIEIQQLWESFTGQNVWTPVAKREFLTGYIYPNNAPVSQFGVWAWQDQEIKLLTSLQANDLKIDYIKYLFTDLTIGSLSNEIAVRGTAMFLMYRIAALAAQFIEENTDRSEGLNLSGLAALERSLGISVKGKQSIPVRRRPFRASYKRRRTMV